MIHIKTWVTDEGEIIAPGWDPRNESEGSYKPRGTLEDMPAELRRMYMDYWTTYGDFMARVVEADGMAGILLNKKTYDGFWDTVGFSGLKSLFRNLSTEIQFETFPDFTPGVSGPFELCVFIPHTESRDVFHWAMYYTHMLSCRGAGRGLAFDEFQALLPHAGNDSATGGGTKDTGPSAAMASSTADSKPAKGIPIEKAGDMVNLFIRLCQACGKGKDDIHRELVDIFDSADLEKMREKGTIASLIADESVELYTPVEQVGKLIHRYDDIYGEMYGPFGIGYEEVLSSLFTKAEISEMGCEKLLPQH